MQALQSFDAFFLVLDSWGILALRIAIAVIFLVHGTSKLNGKMGGFMTFIGICETIGAIAVLIGLLTQLASLGLAIIMIGAIYKKTMEWKVPFTAQNKMGWEFDVAMLGGCLALLTLGCGLYGIDMYIGL